MCACVGNTCDAFSIDRTNLLNCAHWIFRDRISFTQIAIPSPALKSYTVIACIPARMQNQNWCCHYGFSIGIGKITIIVMGYYCCTWTFLWDQLLGIKAELIFMDIWHESAREQRFKTAADNDLIVFYFDWQIRMNGSYYIWMTKLIK